MPSGIAEGMVFTHNHPDGSPPSIGDLIGTAKERLHEMRAIGDEMVYSVRCRPEYRVDIASLEDYYRRIGGAIAWEWTRLKGKSSSVEGELRAQHAVMMDLARRGLIQYKGRHDDRVRTQNRQQRLV